MTEMLLLDSFDRYPSASGLGGMDTVWTSGWSLITGRYFGGKGVRAQSLSNHGGGTRRVIDTFEPIVSMGVAFKPEDSRQCPIMYMSGPSGTLCLSFTDTFRLMVVDRTWGNFGYSSSDVVGVGLKANAIVPNIWQYVEVTVNLITGDICGYVNGELCMELLGTTWYSNKTGFENFGLFVRNSYASYDDFYVRRGTEPLGEIKIESLNVLETVENDMQVIGSTTAHGAISEVPVDGDVSYLSSSTPGDRAAFSLSDLTSLPQNIRAVQVRSFARKNETEVRSVKQFIESSGTLTEGAEHYLGVSYKYLHDIYSVDPSTGEPWSNTAVNAMTFGIKVEK